MRHSKLGLRALGLAILGALSLTAFFAASAQAQLPGESKAGQYLINLSLALLATIHGTQIGTGSLLVQLRNLTIDCTGGLVVDGKIETHDRALVTVLFEGCVAWNFALTTKLQCTVLTAGEPTGSAAATALVLPITHGGEQFLLFEPDNNLNFVVLELHGDKCPLPLLNPVKGAVVALIDANDTVEPELLFSPAIQLLSGDTLTFGGFSSYIDATARVKLTGDHADGLLGTH